MTDTFARDKKVILNFEAIGDDVRDWFGAIFCATCNIGKDYYNMYKEFWFIEECLGMEKGTIYVSLNKFWADANIREELGEAKAKLSTLQKEILS